MPIMASGFVHFGAPFAGIHIARFPLGLRQNGMLTSADQTEQADRLKRPVKNLLHALFTQQSRSIRCGSGLFSYHDFFS
jgi:hypothetical protein